MRSVSERTRNLLALRTEAYRQFRIAFKKNAPASVTDDIRREIERINAELDYATNAR